MAWIWVLFADDGREMRSTEQFDSKDEAESWMTGNWASLAQEGAASVSLRQDDEEEYLMSLAPE